MGVLAPALEPVLTAPLTLEELAFIQARCDVNAVGKSEPRLNMRVSDIRSLLSMARRLVELESALASFRKAVAPFYLSPTEQLLTRARVLGWTPTKGESDARP